MLNLAPLTIEDFRRIGEARLATRRMIALWLVGVPCEVTLMHNLPELMANCRRIGLRYRLRERRMGRLIRLFSATCGRFVESQTVRQQ